MKYEPITGLYQNYPFPFIPNSNRLRGRSANHQGSGPYNQGCVFPFVYKGKEDKDFLRYGRNTKLAKYNYEFRDVGSYQKLGGQAVMWGGAQSAPSG